MVWGRYKQLYMHINWVNETKFDYYIFKFFNTFKCHDILDCCLKLCSNPLYIINTMKFIQTNNNYIYPVSKEDTFEVNSSYVWR